MVKGDKRRMTKLTQEQIKILEDAFNSLPEDMRTGTYRTMEGIQEQLDSGAQIIFYMTRGEDIIDEYGKAFTYAITKMKLGEE